MADEDTLKTDDAADEVIEDTINAAADDTLQADAAADSIAADTAADSVAASSGNDKSPFEQFGNPETPVDEVRTGAGAPDALDTELAAAEAAVEADPDDRDALKRMIAANRKVRQRDSIDKQRQAAQVKTAAEDAAYREFESECGLPDAPKDVRDKLSRTVIKDRFKKLFDAAAKRTGNPDYAMGEATAKLGGEIKQIIAAAKSSTKAAPRVNRTSTGATLTPPGGGGGRQAKEAPKPENVFIAGDWSYPTVDPDMLH